MRGVDTKRLEWLLPYQYTPAGPVTHDWNLQDDRTCSTMPRTVDYVPEYFPRPEVIRELLHADQIQVRDDAQYSRQSWQNRTRIRNPDGWQWLSIPVERGQFGYSIARIRIAYHDGWWTRHLKGLRYNYSTTPFYAHYEPRIVALLDQKPPTLSELTVASTKLLLQSLGHEAAWHEAAVDHSLDSDSVDRSDRILRDQSIPMYRQNYEGFIPGMSTLDILFNLGPHQTADLLSS